jgi:hypothetical protein
MTCTFCIKLKRLRGLKFKCEIFYFIKQALAHKWTIELKNKIAYLTLKLFLIAVYSSSKYRAILSVFEIVLEIYASF